MFFSPLLIVMADFLAYVQTCRNTKLNFKEVDFTRNQLEDVC